MKEKRCSKCEEIKPLTEYNKHKRNKDGFYYVCKECLRSTRARYYQDNKHVFQARNKQWANKNPEKIKEIERRRRQTPEHKTYAKQWREQNKDYIKEYKQSLKGKYSEYRQNAKNRNFVFELTFEQFQSFWKKPCTYCGAEIETIGLDRKNSNAGYTIDNVSPCCYNCNRSKSDLSLDEWNKWRRNVAMMLLKEENQNHIIGILSE